MDHSLNNQMNNINNNGNGNSKKCTWDEDKSFEENLQLFLEYPEKMKDSVSNDENKDPPLKNKTRKVFHWKEEEHMLFLEGLEKYGRGNWKAISKYVGTKTYTQVASHAQKHFIRVDQQNGYSTKKSKRKSKFDTTSWNGDFHPLLYRDYIPPNVETQLIVEQLLQQFQ